MQEHTDEDRGRPFDLPMGGLLSELLASEGIDAGGLEEIREHPPVNSPATAAAAPAEPAQSLLTHNPDVEPAIALPGLLNDLLNLAGAAESAGLPPAPAAPPPEQIQHCLALPPETPDSLETDPVQLPERLEPASFAIPGLLSLLSAEEDCGAEPECPTADPSAQVQPEGGAAVVEEAPAALPVFDPDTRAASLDELEIDDLPETPACALPEAAPEPVAELMDEASPCLTGETPEAWADAAAEGDPAIEQPPIPLEASETVLDSPPEAPEPESGIEPEYSPGHAAAALAEAASRLVIEAAGRSGESPAAALADLMNAAGGVSPAGLDEEALPPPESCERYVVFQIGDQSYGLHITSVREVEKAGRVTPVPGAPPMIHGLINLHGEILPLIDPRPLLALPARDSASGGYLVVVRNSGQDGSVAWLVDGLGGMALLDRDRIAAAGGEGPANAPANAAVSGTARHRGRRLTLLDARRLASEEAIEQAAGGWTARPEVGL